MPPSGVGTDRHHGSGVIRPLANYASSMTATRKISLIMDSM